MNYKRFIEEYLGKGLIKKQKSDFRSAKKLILRAKKDIKTARANLDLQRKRNKILKWRRIPPEYSLDLPSKNLCNL